MLRKANVLVVDDKRANFVALEAVLGEAHNVIFAASGPEAIALCESRRDVDVILMDVQMPVMDGFTAAGHIKRLPGCEDVPIVFITAVYKEDPHIKQGYAAGGIDYFGKPFDPDILRMKVAVYASFRQKADILRQRERHVRESEELLRVGRKLSAVLESLPVGVLIADSQGRLCQTTDAVSEILKSVEPARCDSYGEILGWWDADGRVIKAERGPLARAVVRGEASHSERLSIRCFDGSTKTLLASASALRGLDGGIVGAVILVQDLTETRQIEEDLERRVTKLVSIGVELEESARR